MFRRVVYTKGEDIAVGKIGKGYGKVVMLYHE
jgi:hypothetical protein